MFETPILLLIFNRIDTTVLVFNQIRKVKPRKLYVAADGPRESVNGEYKKCEETRRIIDLVDWECDVKTLYRDENLGCGEAVSSAIDWFFKNEEEGIILEDDCLPEITFFQFCHELLEKYRYDDRVFSIIGNNPINNWACSESYCFTKYNLIWGWASWRRAWDKYSFDMEDWQENKKKGLLRDAFKYDYISQRSWRKHLDQVFNGEIDTWDYQWHYTNWKFNGVNCLPKVNLIKNIGFGDDATHTVEANEHILNTSSDDLTFPLIHPDKIDLNRKADKFIGKKRFCNSYRLFFKAALSSRLKKLVKLK